MVSTRAVLIGSVVIALFVVVMPAVLMLLVMLRTMTGFGGTGGMMGQTIMLPWPAWVVLGFWLLLGVGVIILIVWGIRHEVGERSAVAGESPLTILQRRYAHGEIGHDEYESIRERLLGDRSSR